ncbi:MAG: glycosyltransferase family 4 protein [Planctomycetota bacterium]|nr:glycosyltransferase family 4 protein [Planctomycetota bacterium]
MFVRIPYPGQDRLRVLHIITRLVVGGAQENTILTVAGLREKGFPHVWLAAGPQAGPEGSMSAEAERQLGKIFVVPHLVREVSPWKDTAAYFEISALIRKCRPHIVHTHSAKAGILGRLAARAAGVPFVVHTIHGLPFHRAQSEGLNCLAVLAERSVSRCTDLFIAVSDAMKRQATEAGMMTGGRAMVVRSGMDTRPFLQSVTHRAKMRSELGIADDEFVAGVVARIAPLKGHEFILKLAPRILERHPKVRFVFVGDGQLRGEIESLASRLRIGDRTVFTGLVDPREVPKMIAAMDLVIHASLREGLARVLPQAHLCGKAVVAFDIDGADEVVVPGRTGWLVRAGDADGFVSACLAAVGNPEATRSMGREGRERCAEAYAKEAMIRRIAEEYLTLFS